MAEYFAPTQNVGLNSPILFEASIPCNRGYVLHNDGTGVFILRGITNNCFARYQVTFNGNVSIPTGGAVTAVALALSENGETRPNSEAIYTPAAVDEFGNLICTGIVTVPKGCCFNIAVRYVDATVNDAAVTPTPTITVQNGNLTITRIA